MGSETKMVRLGEYIRVVSCANEKGLKLPFMGVDKSKKIVPTSANIDGLNPEKYQIIKPRQLVFSGMQTGRDVCIRIAINAEKDSFLISPAYTLFEVKDENILCPEFVYLFFCSSERDRLGWFYSDSSIRSNLDWDRFCDVQIPLPPIEIQRSCVELYKTLEQTALQSEALACEVSRLCAGEIVRCKKIFPPVSLGEYIEQCDERNNDLNIKLSQGISNLKYFQDPKQVATNSMSDKIVRKGQIAYNRATTRNGEKISIALREGEDCTVSSAYQVFKIKDEKILNPQYLMLWFRRPEFDRYARYMSKGSAHEFFEFEEMSRVQIPLPPIQVQQKLSDLFSCSKAARDAARKARELISKLCPALIQLVKHT